jgi:hypothetical protein
MFQLWIDFAGLQNRGQGEGGGGRVVACEGGQREGRERVMYKTVYCVYIIIYLQNISALTFTIDLVCV